MRKHTLTLWKWGTGSHYAELFDAVGDRVLLVGEDIDGNLAVSEAHKQLIAAAPELFEACTIALDDIHTEGGPLHVAKALEKALAGATGGMTESDLTVRELRDDTDRFDHAQELVD